MEKTRILVIDDEESLCEILQFNLEVEGFLVDVAYNAEEALKKNLTQYSLILLDVMMGETSGFKLAQQLKRQPETAHIPIIFCTAKDSEDDTVIGLDIGADDYITKPFGTGELLARVRAALRVNRYGGGSLPGGVFSAQGLTINYERRKVFVDGQEVRLTQTEYNIVAFLSEHAGRVMTYAAIVRAIWGDTDASSTKKLQVNMANIRKKLGSRPGSNTYILNELGVGYRMIEEDAKPLEPAEETK